MIKKIPVGILGATGTVGQKFVELLTDHPWFEIVAVAASERLTTRKYGESVNWLMPTPLAKKVADLPLIACEPNLPCFLVFSSLPTSIAQETEKKFAAAGYCVISNASAHRLAADVPLLIPEVNPEHLKLLSNQQFGKGALITNPNCSVIGMVLALKPLLDKWGIEEVKVVTLQALSGAGYPGIASLDSLDNVIPFIEGEENKIETEPLKIMGSYQKGKDQKGNDQKSKIIPYSMRLSAQCLRVAVTEGHLACLSVKFTQKPSLEEIIQAWQQFKGEPQQLQLPSAPQQPLIYLANETYPQPKLHRLLEKGMAVTIGRLQACPVLDCKFVILSHNTIRGAAGGAILNAELLLKKGYFDATIKDLKN